MVLNILYINMHVSYTSIDAMNSYEKISHTA